MKATARKHVIASRTASRPAEDTAVLILDDRGMIRDCDRVGEALFKYCRNELVWLHVSLLLPQLADLDLLQNGELNAGLRYLCRIGRHFDAVAQDGERFTSELFLNFLGNTGHSHLTLLVRPTFLAASTYCANRPKKSLEHPLLQRIAC